MSEETLKKANALTRKIEKANEFLSALSQATFMERSASIRVQADTYKSGEMHLDKEVVSVIRPNVEVLVNEWQAELDAL